MTVAQLYYGAYKDKWGSNKIASLENQLKNYVVLPYDYLTCQMWAMIKRQCETDFNIVIEVGDCWIAASALRYNCPLATGNGKHFKNVKGLKLISPGFI
jgi:tRNA(fMet)-specific endonuclease VapC